MMSGERIKFCRFRSGNPREHRSTSRGDGGGFFEPTVLADVDHSMLCMTEETFGPTVPVMKVADAEEAVRLAKEGAGLANKTYGFCGDIGRGRTVRSLAELLAGYDGVTLAFVAPRHPTLSLSEDLRERARRHDVPVIVNDSLEDAIGEVLDLVLRRADQLVGVS